MKEGDKVCIFLHFFSHVLIFLLGKLELQVERNKENYFGKDYHDFSTNTSQLKSEDIG